VLGEYLQRNNPRMEVVLVTGDDDPRVERSSLRAGLSFVAKPFLPRDIFDAVDVSEKFIPFFKTGKDLRERLNSKA
jgi:FixJ family two-component response regulator